MLAVQAVRPWTTGSCQGEMEFLEVKQRYDVIHGSDYNLLNGRQYYLLYSNTSHPFLNTELARTGKVVLSGVVYDGIPINYDLYQQVVILQYISNTGEIRYLVLNKEFLEEFRLDGKVFRKAGPPGEEEYAQVIEAGTLRLLIFWNRNMHYTASMNQTPYRYSDPSKKIFLEKNGVLQPVNSGSSFLSHFSEAQKSAVRQYMRQERIRIKRASDLQLQKLLEYSARLEEGGP